MHWSSGLFLLLILIWLLPINVQITAEHRQHWSGAVTVQFIWLHRTKTFEQHKTEASFQTVPDAVPVGQKAEKSQNRQQRSKMGKKKNKDDHIPIARASGRQSWRQRTSFQAHWKGIILFALQAGPVVLKRLQLQQLSLSYRIGFTQPDWTAYGYGLFWTICSLLPAAWLERGTIICIPDFKQPCQEFALHGIISCSIGQLISILILLLWLAVKAALVQKRKEQMLYEG